MWDPVSNPDVAGFPDAISQTPVLLDTSIEDYTLPNGDTWWNFRNIRSPAKIFLNIRGIVQGHMEPVEVGLDGPWAGVFAQAYSLGNATAKHLLLGDCEACLRNAVPYGLAGMRNSGDGEVGILLCDPDQPPWPEAFGALCTAPWPA